MSLWRFLRSLSRRRSRKPRRRSAASLSVKRLEERDCPTGSGTGLLATYYRGTDLAGPAALPATVVPVVDFNWAPGHPIPDSGSSSFSARFTGQVEPLETGPITFTTRSDDGVLLYINNKLLINDWSDHSARNDSGTISLVAGQRYDLVLEYFENNERPAVMQLSWASPDQAKQIIPTTQLYPETIPAPPFTFVSKEDGEGDKAKNAIELLYSKDKSTPIEGIDGAFAWPINWTLSTKANKTNGGWIIAQVQITYDLTNQKTGKPIPVHPALGPEKNLDFWVALRVDPGKEAPKPLPLPKDSLAALAKANNKVIIKDQLASMWIWAAAAGEGSGGSITIEIRQARFLDNMAVNALPPDFKIDLTSRVKSLDIRYMPTQGKEKVIEKLLAQQKEKSEVLSLDFLAKWSWSLGAPQKRNTETQVKAS